MKTNTKQTTENYLENLEEASLKKEIEALTVPWNKFRYVGRFSEIYYDTATLTRFFGRSSLYSKIREHRNSMWNWYDEYFGWLCKI